MSSIAARRLPGGRSFHLLLAGLAVSAVGDWLYNVALLAFVYERTHSPGWVAFTTAARVLPMVAIGPFGGALADRVDRRALIAASDLVRAALMVALAAVAAFGGPLVLAPVLAALAVAAGTVHPPAVGASTARLVDDAELPRAQALRAAIGQTAIVAGPALGALLLMVAGPAPAILLNGLTFLASAAAVLAIAPGPAFRPGAAGTPIGWLADVRAGARALRGAPVALRLIGADVLCSVVYGFLTVALVLVSARLGAGSAGYGVLLGGFGAGGIAGALLAGRIETRIGWRRALAGALVLVALTLVALGLVPAFAVAVALAPVAGSGMVVGEVLWETALPRMVGDEVLARAYGLVIPVAIAGIAAGSLVAGPLISLLGLAGALAAIGTFVLVAAALLTAPTARRRLAPLPA